MDEQDDALPPMGLPRVDLPGLAILKARLDAEEERLLELGRRAGIVADRVREACRRIAAREIEDQRLRLRPAARLAAAGIVI
jgi:hypothetical protein